MSVFFLLLFSALLSAQAPDLILHNGKIVTVNAKFEIVQAVAVRGDRIVAAGANQAILRSKGANTKIVDLQGKTVLPGLMDSHTHAVDAAMYEFDHPIGDMETIADVLAYFRARAKVTPKGEWITLRQVFITRLREQRYPTRKELDEAAPDHPVLFGTGPDAMLNTKALQAAGITRAKHPAESSRAKIERDPQTGEPTGVLRSSGAFVKTTGRSAPTLEDRIRRFQLLMADYNSLGITSIADRNASDGNVEVYRTLHQRNGLTTRVFLSAQLDANQPREKVEERIRKLAADPLHKYDSMLWLRGVKSFLDGGMLTGSAYMREPWGVSKIYSITDPNYRGLRYIEAEPLYFAARLALKNDLQFTAHSVGDGAVHALIEAYERINKEFPVRPHRPCITHCNFMSPEAIDRMAAAGIVADLQPAWLERDGATLRKQFGDPRLRFFQPYKTLSDKKVIVGGGSDHMQKIGGLRSINPYNPFFGMWVTVTRQPRWTDKPLHTEEALTREQAIRLYTINNAFILFDEKNKGSLEPGKYADLIVLDRDILTCPVDQIKDIRVQQTWLGGRKVYGE